MSLQVNMLDPEERRNPSLLNPRSLMRISLLTIPTVLLVLFGKLAITVMAVRSEHQQLTEQWENLEPRQQEAEARRREIAANKEVLTQLSGWRSVRVQWSGLLLHVAQSTPPTVQLRALNINYREHGVSKQRKVPEREYLLSLVGRTRSDSLSAAEEQIRVFSDSIASHELVVSGKPLLAGDTGADATTRDYVFSIDFELVSKRYE